MIRTTKATLILKLICMGCCVFFTVGCRDQPTTDKAIRLTKKLQDLHNLELKVAQDVSARDRWKRTGAAEWKAEPLNTLYTQISDAKNQLKIVHQELASGGQSSAALKVLSDATAAMDDSTALFRFIEGVDATAQRLGPADKQNDPFFLSLISRDRLPGTLQEVLEMLRQDHSEMTRESFLLGEGSQIPVASSTPLEFNRGFRFVVTWNREGRPEILLGTPAGARSGFLEVMAWDPQKRAFNYYERQQPSSPLWFWKGDSSNAIQLKSRGKACFRCHINGNPIMRELNRPWDNWHSEAVSITSTVPDEIRHQQPRRELFSNKEQARILEDGVRDGISRWTTERIARSIDDQNIRNVSSWTRQMLTTSNTNLGSSQTTSDKLMAIDPESIDLPRSFFLNFDAFEQVISMSLPSIDTRVKRSDYEAALTNHSFQLIGGIPDTFFAFSIPEPSGEDLVAIRLLLERKIITSKLAASLLMVDFPNPVYSQKRNQLFEYIKTIETGEFTTAGSNVDEQIVAAIRTHSQPNSLPINLLQVQQLGPADQFLFYYLLPDKGREKIMIAHLQEYLTSVRQQLDHSQGVDDYLMLAVSRRNQFAAMLPGTLMIQETDILFPSTPTVDPKWVMGTDGRPHHQSNSPF
ncbi:MAG: hypothetical protein HOO92_03660 [Methylococcaceae bacterium]|nr:hypothetical protein [Methylococcaceae bacterium]